MFQKATKAQRKLRAAMFGPSGAGKTFTSLQIAKGLGGSIAVIDTERGSASLYSDRFDFDVADLTDRSIKGYVKAIKAAAAYDVLIVDSLSHAWQELMAEVDKLANAKYRGNTWSAWSEGTPLQRLLVDTILDFPGHVITTMRSKTEWTTEKNTRGKDTPVRVGLSPEQGKGIEYEFDVLFEIGVDHTVNVIKDRSSKFQDRLIKEPGPEFGQELRAWLSDGNPLSERPVAASPAPAQPATPARQAAAPAAARPAAAPATAPATRNGASAPAAAPAPTVDSAAEQLARSTGGTVVADPPAADPDPAPAEQGEPLPERTDLTGAIGALYRAGRQAGLTTSGWATIARACPGGEVTPDMAASMIRTNALADPARVANYNRGLNSRGEVV